MLRYILFIFTLTTAVSSCVSEEKIVSRTENKKEKVEGKLEDFEPSLTSSDNVDQFYKVEKTYEQPGNIQDVWEVYCHTDPKILWKGPKSKFRMAYSSPSHVGFFRKESIIPCLSLGMIYNLRLKVLAFYKIPVTFEITELSYDKKIIEFTYGMDNRSHGKQILHFESSETGTKVTHTSYYLSGNKIRDKKLYPYFHEKYLDEFHENIKKRLSNFISAH